MQISAANRLARSGVCVKERSGFLKTNYVCRGLSSLPEADSISRLGC